MSNAKALRIKRQAEKMIDDANQQAEVFRPGEKVQKFNGPVAGPETSQGEIPIDLEWVAESDVIDKGGNATCDVKEAANVEENDILLFKGTRLEVVGDLPNYIFNIITHRTLTLRHERKDGN